MEDVSKRFSSTVFLCETTEDSRYVRCDFKHCSEHSLNKKPNEIPVSCWYLNTPRNCKSLERHVGEQINSFVKDVEQSDHKEFELNKHLIENNDKLLSQFTKVLIIFNIRSLQSSYGTWTDEFLKAKAYTEIGKEVDYINITLSFSSRMELLQNIESLRNVTLNSSCEIMVLLSCHSSSQGQVFSCTPVEISKEYGFEEFCSLHDFVGSCQDVLGRRLKIIHVSSCFALKLNKSHIVWPVDISWLKKDLKCVLSGSAKEVYETGSQTADLFLLMKTLFSNKSSLVVSFMQAFTEASYRSFPDLVLEMGLCYVDIATINTMLNDEEQNDKVSIPNLLSSTLQLVIVYTKTDIISVTLKNALLSNLRTRFTDFEHSVSIVAVINLLDDDYCLSIEDNHSDKKVFFLVLSSIDNYDDFIDKVINWGCKTSHNLYGVHFNKFVNQHENSLLQCNNIEVTAFLQTDIVDYSECFPVLLYLAQLVLGENGIKLKTIIDDNIDKQWSLTDVYHEICSVLDGLSKKCKFVILASNKSKDRNDLSNFDEKHKCTAPKIAINNLNSSTLTPICNENKIDNCSRKEQNAINANDENLLNASSERDTKVNIDKISQSRDETLPDIFSNDLKDVPLMANVNEVHVFHYILNLDVNFNQRCITGRELLFPKPAKEEIGEREFQMCLDCTLIDITTVEEILLPDDFQHHFHQEDCCCNGETIFCPSCQFLHSDTNHERKELNFRTLPYAVYGWCIRIWNDNSSKPNYWPRCVAINYKTKPIGPSLIWCKDQDNNDCCYTPGAYINNRSMMPCQEPPVAMATWQATIMVPKGFMALSSGDVLKCKQIVLKRKNESPTKEIFCFEMRLPLPSSTLAFAFGKFSKSTKSIDCVCPPDQKTIPVSLYSSSTMIKQFEQEYHELAALYLKNCCKMLGSYPFSRLDLVVMPRSFACMGLESPNIMFLSQSILCGDKSMSTRIAHEISHAWFGLLVGAKDWTEEWLSEGFATYVEDRVVCMSNGMTESTGDGSGFIAYSGLQQTLRLKVLQGELQQTEDENLKRLRPQRTQNYLTAVEAVNENVSTNETHIRPYETVPNAAIASKKWSQVHYLKGYFLLLHMAKKVGYENFDRFLASYLAKYSKQLVTSEMFFDFYVTFFDLDSKLKQTFLSDWLESSQLPDVAEEEMNENVLMNKVNDEFEYWKTNNAANKRCRSRGLKRRKGNFNKQDDLNSNQLVLLLEKLLIIESVIPQTLTQINLVYNMANRNAEVRHRWCELIIKNKCSSRYNQVKRFLIEDQGMGIYLFGELMLFGIDKQNQIAKEVFALLKDEMDKSTRETVQDLVYPQ